MLLHLIYFPILSLFYGFDDVLCYGQGVFGHFPRFWSKHDFFCYMENGRLCGRRLFIFDLVLYA